MSDRSIQLMMSHFDQTGPEKIREEIVVAVDAADARKLYKSKRHQKFYEPKAPQFLNLRPINVMNLRPNKFYEPKAP